MITLTQDERNKFAAYLEQEAESDKILLQQMAKISSPGMTAMIAERRHQIIASIMVAKKLRSFEEQTI